MVFRQYKRERQHEFLGTIIAARSVQAFSPAGGVPFFRQSTLRHSVRAVPGVGVHRIRRARQRRNDNRKPPRIIISPLTVRVCADRYVHAFFDYF